MQHATLPATPFARLAGGVRTLTERYWRLVLVAMLALLHVAVVRGVADPWARALLLAHLGLVLIWVGRRWCRRLVESAVSVGGADGAGSRSRR